MVFFRIKFWSSDIQEVVWFKFLASFVFIEKDLILHQQMIEETTEKMSQSHPHCLTDTCFLHLNVTLIQQQFSNENGGKTSVSPLLK